MALDFIDGDATPNNTVILTNFLTDGIVGLASTIGDVSGALPGRVILGDAEFFNEFLQPITLGRPSLSPCT